MSVFLNEMTDFLTSLAVRPGELLVTGDFNIHVDDTNDPNSRRFLEILDSLNLVQHDTEPTHKAGHTLDLVITHKDGDILNSKPFAHYYLSSHSTIVYTLKFLKPRPLQKIIKCRKLKSVDIGELKKDLKRSELLHLNDHADISVDELSLKYHETLSALLDKHAPLIVRKVPARKCLPWFNDEIASAKRLRCRYERKWRKSGLESD